MSPHPGAQAALSPESFKHPEVRFARPRGLLRRLGLMALLFSAESIFFSLWLDTATIRRTVGLTGLIANFGPAGLSVAVGTAAFFVALIALEGSKVLETPFALPEASFHWGALLWHLPALIAFAAISHRLFTTDATAGSTDLLAAVWAAAGVLTFGTGAICFLPPAFYLRLLRNSGKWIAVAAAAGLLAFASGKLAILLWKPAASLTFRLTAWCLQLFVPEIVSNPVSRVIGTHYFRVAISPQCSGLEGAGLMLVFGAFFLWLCRRELRIARAFLALIAGIWVVWVLNVGRITLLILIGNAGARNVAMGGFHSQAGWIGFTAVAVVFCLGLQRIRWLQKDWPASATPLPDTAIPNPAIPYLVPLLAILAASMISGAASAGFEWLYPLRFFAPVAALWCYRSRYREIGYAKGWFGPIIGVAAFAVWIGLIRFAGIPAHARSTAELRAAPVLLAGAWIAIRILAAVVTVPIAEELAFRGFLIRRIISADFLSLSPRTFTIFSILLSSLVFGLLHGERWLAATAAGILYGVALVRRGRIGDAVAAHASSNALLVAWVLWRGDWSVW